MTILNQWTIDLIAPVNKFDQKIELRQIKQAEAEAKIEIIKEKMNWSIVRPEGKK